MGFPGVDLKPLERGMDALVRMADALERLADLGEKVFEQIGAGQKSS